MTTGWDFGWYLRRSFELMDSPNMIQLQLRTFKRQPKIPQHQSFLPDFGAKTCRLLSSWSGSRVQCNFAFFMIHLEMIMKSGRWAHICVQLSTSKSLDGWTKVLIPFVYILETRAQPRECWTILGPKLSWDLYNFCLFESLRLPPNGGIITLILPDQISCEIWTSTSRDRIIGHLGLSLSARWTLTLISFLSKLIWLSRWINIRDDFRSINHRLCTRLCLKVSQF